MAKTFTKNTPAINMTVVGFGQAGSRIADEFASIKNENGNSVYNCLALNSNDGDLKGLKYITESNRVSLNLGGLGKNPQKAISILEENEDVKNRLKGFIQERVRPTDDLVLFFAGLGGGTGTSTIVKALEEFYDFNNKPLIKKELVKLQSEIEPKEFKENLKKYMKIAIKKAEEKFIKVGVVVTLPLRADGPDALRQVNDFAQRIWKIGQDKTKGIAFIKFADNQHFYDEFKKLPENERGNVENYRDYANKRFSEVFHELNTATTGGGTSVTFDSQDFRRIILENTGSLVINKLTKPITNINNGHDVKEMILDSMEGSCFHQPIELTNILENGDMVAAKVHHIGLLAVLDEKKSLGSSFIDDARVEITEKNTFSLSGTVFTGYLEEKNDHSATVYTFYKTDGLPARLAKGLVKEYEEFQERQKAVIYQSASIESINDEDDDDDFNIDLAEFGLEEVASTKEEDQNENKNNYEVDIDNLNFDDLDD
ncbi:cell division protein FtsZ [Metabacillus endolithicus]|uniref:Cell division protein FtsZ n=1 Tax=Metabacillus endolithicus TaxID=1535204 RepID=A0ABW5C2Q5_9BACI|nr:cell division protein FtsZ [Metabacillus endolithicus]UPG66099.1 cell division protein FtsZ [Metabacillus endolithicus]